MSARFSPVLLSLFLALWLGGCDTATQALEGPIPPLPAGEARLFFYRDANVYDGLLTTIVSLNGVPVGASELGTVFYRDVAPGTYQIGARSDKLYPDQVKTVAVAPGTTTYVRVQTLPYWGQSGWQWQGNTFIVSIVNPAMAEQEIIPLQHIRG
ncbi:MAG TPA: DUF2846 domain-containing protein [Stellaceae bacterium]|nr:DUF2846 domain-containing protein [Stellaceae bacterium]